MTMYFQEESSCTKFKDIILNVKIKRHYHSKWRAANVLELYINCLRVVIHKKVITYEVMVSWS